MPDQQVVGAQLAGDLAIAEGQPDSALTWFTRALAADPGSDQSLIGVIRSYVARGDLDGALAYLDEHKGSRPDDAVPYQLLGELFARRGDAGKAEAAFRQAIQLRPSWLPPYVQLAELLDQTGRAGDAVAVYEQARAQDPRNIGLNFQLAQSYQKLGRIDDALQAYERLLQFDPNVDAAINNYAALVADYRNDDTEALARALTLATRFQSGENGNFLDTLGWLYYRTGDFNRAVGSSRAGRAPGAQRPAASLPSRYGTGPQRSEGARPGRAGPRSAVRRQLSWRRRGARDPAAASCRRSRRSLSRRR